jgi:hypothetical protein
MKMDGELCVGTVLDLALQEDVQPSKSPFTEPVRGRVLMLTFLSHNSATVSYDLRTSSRADMVPLMRDTERRLAVYSYKGKKCVCVCAFVSGCVRPLL